MKTSFCGIGEEYVFDRVKAIVSMLVFDRVLTIHFYHEKFNSRLHSTNRPSLVYQICWKTKSIFQAQHSGCEKFLYEI